VKAFALLAATISCEVTGSLALAAAQDHPAWYAVTIGGYLASFWLLAQVLRAGMPLGVAYGIWGACGVALTALGGTVLFDDPLTPTMMAGMALIVAGVLLVQVGSERARAAAHTTPVTHVTTAASPQPEATS
jgi:small multidrug resistance pump